MIKKIHLNFIRLKLAAKQVKSAYPWELKNVSGCLKTGKHLLEIKVSGKSQSLTCLADEVVSNDDLIKSFSPIDIRTICYLAACDKYEKILEEEKIKKVFEVLRYASINGEKSVQLRHKINGEITVIPIKEFANNDIIESLDATDVYQLGYLSGQVQTLKDLIKIKLITNRG